MRGGDNSAVLPWLSRTAILLAATLTLQLAGFPQLITGPAVNAMLLIASLTAGPASGVVIGLLTPALALFRGILPPPLAPLLPFIALANAALVLIFTALVPLNRWMALVVASLAKFVLLSCAVRFLTVPPPVAAMMQVPQLITALTGGAAAISAHSLLAGFRSRSPYSRSSRPRSRG